MKGFLAGLGTGLVILVIVVAFRGPAPLPATHAPAPPGDPARELARRLEEERTAKAATEKRLAEVQARAEELQRKLDASTAAKPADPAPKPSAAPTEAPDAEAAGKAARARALLKMGIQVGKPLPDDVATLLGLEPAQRAALDAALADEGRLLYGSLREIAAADPSQKLPEQDGPGTLIAALGKSMSDLAKFNEIFKDEEVAAGRKNVYLDEHFGADSPLVRIAERLDSIRKGMFDRVQPSLTPEQFAKFRELYERNFSFGGAQYSLPANVLPRR